VVRSLQPSGTNSPGTIS